ncbi:MAG: hypothetical protein JO256_11840 [Alphaproteobacteria bacterium]|nr:hypothetical protein [Alphaproteobacteria bacterium]
MTKFKLLLVLLCLGLLGAMPFVISASKPNTTGDQRVSTIEGQTAVQRQLAAERAGPEVVQYWRTILSDPLVRPQIERAFYQARDLANAGKYKEALAVIDGTKGIPKTTPVAEAMGQMRTFLMWHLNSQVR